VDNRLLAPSRNATLSINFQPYCEALLAVKPHTEQHLQMPDDVLIYPTTGQESGSTPQQAMLAILSFSRGRWPTDNWDISSYSRDQELADSFPPGSRVDILSGCGGAMELDCLDSSFGLVLSYFPSDSSCYLSLTYCVVESPLSYSSLLPSLAGLAPGRFWAAVTYGKQCEVESDPGFLAFLSDLHGCSVDIWTKTVE
jgi:hypothetical protein